MRTGKFIFVSLVLAAMMAVSASAQTASGKIGVINTFLFDQEKGGIAKYTAAMNSLETEFKPTNQQLQTIAQQMSTLKTEIETLQKSASNPNIPVKTDSVNGKIEQYNRLARELKFKQEDAKARFESRRQTVLGPVLRDIGKAMQEYADKNGFSMLLDAAKLDSAGLILAFDRKLDVTADFIRFYNARPAGTASTSN